MHLKLIPWLTAACAVFASDSVISEVVQDGSKPIVDVRFDEPYLQLENSSGDEWAPTWGRDDVLYTANDDGSSFGGVPANAIAFGKVEGDHPKHLKGTTVNGMAEYRQVPVAGPEGAIWKASHSYRDQGKLYRFAPCPQNEGASCLMASVDGGKTWLPAGTTFPATTLEDLRFITFESGYERIASVLYGESFKDHVYVAAYAGVVEGEDRYIIGRVPKERLASAGAGDWVFSSNEGLLDGWTSKLENAKPRVNSLELGPDMANWKATNTYSVDGVLYMFVTRSIYPWNGDDPKRRHIWRDASVIKSTDKGVTWMRSALENFRSPMFLGQRFGAPYFVWYGKDGAATVDNADKFVYAVSNDGYFESGDDFVLGRVPRERLGHLSASDWTFWKAGDGMSDASWTKDLNEARSILSNPGKSSMTGVTYLPHLGRYVMVQWHFKLISWETVLKQKEFSTILEFYEAAKPWGPWTRFKTYATGIPGWYVPVVGQRFQHAIDAHSVSASLIATGFMNDGKADLYKVNYMPVTFSTKPLRYKEPGYIGAR